MFAHKRAFGFVRGACCVVFLNCAAICAHAADIVVVRSTSNTGSYLPGVRLKLSAGIFRPSAVRKGATDSVMFPRVRSRSARTISATILRPSRSPCRRRRHDGRPQSRRRGAETGRLYGRRLSRRPLACVAAEANGDEHCRHHFRGLDRQSSRSQCRGGRRAAAGREPVARARRGPLHQHPRHRAESQPGD